MYNYLLFFLLGQSWPQQPANLTRSMDQRELEDEVVRLYPIMKINEQKRYDLEEAYEQAKRSCHIIHQDLLYISKGGPMTFEHNLLEEANVAFLRESALLVHFQKLRHKNVEKLYQLLNEQNDYVMHGDNWD